MDKDTKTASLHSSPLHCKIAKKTKKDVTNNTPSIITKDWGQYCMSTVKFGEDFLLLMDEFEEYEENSDIVYNKALLLDAFKYDELYMVSVYETDSMHKRNAYMDDVFCKDSYYLLPCFCVKQNTIVTMIWVHPRIRHLGIGKKIMQMLYKPIETPSRKTWATAIYSVFEKWRAK
jgi:GNAT superfamily N-acetyltransferase